MSYSSMTLGEIVQRSDGSILTGPFGTSLKAAEYSDRGQPIISVGEIGPGTLRLRPDTPRASAEVVARLPEYSLQAGDIIVARKGAVDRSAHVKESQVGWFLGSDALRVRLGASVDSRFVSYALQLPASRAWLLRHAAGSTLLSLSGAVLGELPLPVPEGREQQAIAEVLGALDDKIAANGKLGESVDELCQLRFSSMVGESLGYLRDIALVNREVVIPGQGSLRYLDIAGVGVGRYEWPEETEWADAPGRARRRVQSGDVVWSTVRPNRRSHALILDEDPLLVASTGLAILTPLGVGSAWLYEATRLPQFTDYLVATADGSAYPAVRAERFFEAPAPLADRVVMDAFECFAMPLRRRAHAATVESRELAALRDTLLPELMSGRLRVRDAERAVEDAL